MEKQRGTTRKVFIFKRLVVKVAIVEWGMILQIIKKNFTLLKKHRLYYFSFKKELRENFTKLMNLRVRERFGVEVVSLKRFEVDSNTLLFCFLLGILPNIQERKFYKKTKNPFVMPTYFSLLGLVNFQKRGKRIDFWGDRDVFAYLCQNSQNRNQPHLDGHTLSEIENFVLDDDNHIKLVDYGNKQVAPFLEMNGEKLYSKFKLPE